MTNNLSRRIAQHSDSSGNRSTFTGRYNCHHLVYYEEHQTPSEAIRREKLIKGKSRKWKDELIGAFNPAWKFLENDALP
ncbi:MAG: putative endonuclease [Bacteroidia bacterium]|jgi:putative endonuclease